MNQEKLIGRGSFGEVIRATDKETNVDVAIKIIEKMRLNEPDEKLVRNEVINHK